MALTFVLFLVLWGPFILKLKDPRLEMYPAIIFPSGAGVVKTQLDFLTAKKYEIYGCKNDPVEISKKEFFGDIPVWYFHAVLQGNFGLERYSEKFKLYKPPIQFEIKNTFTTESVSETKKWLRTRLQELGFEDSSLILRQYEMIYNVKTKKLETERIVNEKVYDLY